MNKYFLQKQQSAMMSVSILQEEVETYRALLIAELRRLGATDDEIALIRDATIRNSIRKHRKPEDVAWAILQ